MKDPIGKTIKASAGENMQKFIYSNYREKLYKQLY
jgi:hypothetical protein